MPIRKRRGVKPKLKRKSSSKVRTKHVRKKPARKPVKRAVKKKKLRAPVKRKRTNTVVARKPVKTRRRPAPKRRKVVSRPSNTNRAPIRRRVSWAGILKLPGLSTIVDHSGDTNGQPLTKRRQRQFTNRDDDSRSTRQPAKDRAKKKRKRKVSAPVRKRKATRRTSK